MAFLKSLRMTGVTIPQSVAAARCDQAGIKVGLAAGIVLLLLLLLIVRKYDHFADGALPIAAGAIRARTFIVRSLYQSRRQRWVSERSRNGDQC
jgi:hypothetical protein